MGGWSFEFSQPTSVEDPTHTSVEFECLSKGLDLWFGAFWGPPKGIAITPPYLGLDIALDITVIADSDFIFDCQMIPKSLFCSCSIQEGTDISHLLSAPRHA